MGIYYEDEEANVLAGFRLIMPLVFGHGYSPENLHPERGYIRAYVIKDTSNSDFTGNKFSGNLKKKSVSLSKRIPYFRLFRVDRIGAWTDMNKTFSKYPELYNDAGDYHIFNILAQISKDEFPYGEVQLELPRKLRTAQNKKK